MVADHYQNNNNNNNNGKSPWNPNGSENPMSYTELFMFSSNGDEGCSSQGYMNNLMDHTEFSMKNNKWDGASTSQSNPNMNNHMELTLPMVNQIQSHEQLVVENMPPGFRFVPTEQELIVKHLKKKIDNMYTYDWLIPKVDVYSANPINLTREYGKKLELDQTEWFFFTSRNRKYPNGYRPNRGAGDGVWKPTGILADILDDKRIKIGTKRVLDFFSGKPPNLERLNWKMHEYEVIEENNSNAEKIEPNNRKVKGKNILPKKRNGKGKQILPKNPELEGFVLCKIYTTHKKDDKKKVEPSEDHQAENDVNQAQNMQNPIQENLQILDALLNTQNSIQEVGTSSSIPPNTDYSHLWNSNIASMSYPNTPWLPDFCESLLRMCDPELDTINAQNEEGSLIYFP